MNGATVVRQGGKSVWKAGGRAGCAWLLVPLQHICPVVDVPERRLVKGACFAADQTVEQPIVEEEEA